MNQKTILFFLMLCFSTFFGQSQIVSTESFNATTFAPTGWSIKPDMSPNNVWVRQINGTFPTTIAHSGAGMARFRSRLFAAGTKQILVTRPIDYTNRGTNTAGLDFWMYRDSLSPLNLDSLTVWVNSTDTLDGTAVHLGTIVRNRSIALPDTQAANGWYHYTFAIPASFTGTTTRFIFEGTSESIVVNQGANIFIDDVSFDEFPPVCTGVPNVGNIMNPTPVICGGGGATTLSLSAPITGLIGISYQWQSASSATGTYSDIGINSSVLPIPSITSTTFYHCVVTCSFSGSTYTTPIDSIVVSANTPPVIAVTPASAVFCAGTAGVQLVATGALTYSWAPAASLNVSTGDTVIASPSANTQYLLTGTAADGCTDTTLVNVTVNPGPTVNITASPNDTVCAGSTVILNSVPTGGTGNIYLWSDGITSRRDTIIVNATITLSVIVTNTAGCSNTDTITVVATPGSVANFGYANTGNTFQFTDSSSAATAWTWTFGDGNGSSNQNPTYTYSTPGTYTVTLIISGTGCNDDTITKVIVVGPEGLNDLSENHQISSYPNPVKDQLNISFDHQVIDAVTIRNSVGQVVLTHTNTGNSASIIIPVRTLPSGIYSAELSVKGRIYPVRFVKD